MEGSNNATAVKRKDCLLLKQATLRCPNSFRAERSLVGTDFSVLHLQNIPFRHQPKKALCRPGASLQSKRNLGSTCCANCGSQHLAFNEGRLEKVFLEHLMIDRYFLHLVQSTERASYFGTLGKTETPFLPTHYYYYYSKHHFIINDFFWLAHYRKIR